ncbi:polysaccharide deacetylase family protein [Sutcliffiella horikoshii]|uniref:polysaccharide deacetylase family protein n=1 Tax=Sutcliffiella horikoshii TaxID=79883 RepID=UPI002040EF94|nr:polysaccharide deacetylase family protein [Sutcliffiella horikoshii]MCM3618940.1 polysaccharide deacetylase family protein [Sutcliffiella horikoshii]
MLTLLKRSVLMTLFLLFASILLQVTAFAETKTRSEYEKTGQVLWEVNTQEKIVALTFDDGPHPVYTPILLDILEKYEAKATFFVVGSNVEKNPDIIKNIVMGSHEIGNHTFSHSYDTTIKPEKMVEEIEKTNNILLLETGNRPRFFRPVGGYFSQDIIDSAVGLKHKVLLWSWHQDPRDWDSKSASDIANHIMKNIHPGDVILLHDGGGNRMQTIEAVEILIPKLQSEGYRFVTVSELWSD